MGSGNSKNKEEIKNDALISNFSNINLNFEEKEKIPVNSVKRLECQVPKDRIDSENVNAYITINKPSNQTLKDIISSNEILIKDLPDNRAEVQDASKYPFCCIGLITGKYLDKSTSTNDTIKKIKIVEGTGALISPRHVLTCAHNVYNREIKYEYFDLVFNLELDKPYFLKKIKVVKAYYPEEYNDQLYEDYALLELGENVEGFGFFGLEPSFSFPINTSYYLYGYPETKCLNSNYSLWGMEGKSNSNGIKLWSKNQVLMYNVFHAEKGQSGSPIIFKRN